MGPPEKLMSRDKAAPTATPNIVSVCIPYRALVLGELKLRTRQSLGGERAMEF